MKINENLLKTIKNLIFPSVSLIISLVLYFVFVVPFNNYQNSFPALKSDYENSIKILSSNLIVLKKANESSEKLSKLLPILRSLVPDSANPSDIVGEIINNASESRLRSVDENRSITNPENDKKKLMEVRFNGRFPGMASSISFLKEIATSKEKLIKISRLELTNIPEELFTRVSFNAFSIYAGATPKKPFESPIEDLFSDSKFMELFNSF